MTLPSIAELDISDKRVLIRVDFDVPLGKDGEVLNKAKILSAIPTIKYALGQKAKVIIASGLGHPKGRYNKNFSLEPVGRILSEILDAEIFFPDNSIGEAVKKIGSDMQPGQVALLENLEFHKAELENSPEFAKKLANCADIYVNEAFALSNQKGASLNSIFGYFEKLCVGFQFKKELENLDRIRNPERPFTAVFGGSNVLEKLDIMESMLEYVDMVLVGGVLANTFLSVLGGETGKSKIDETAIYSVKRFMSSAEIRNIRVILPEDIVAIDGELNNYSSSFIISGGRVPQNMRVVDIGPAAQADFAKRLAKAKTILWAGPLGVCEDPEFKKGTDFLAKTLAETDTFNVIIGQDTIEAVLESNEKGTSSFISQAGETGLNYIIGNRLPVIVSMEERIK
ncbi:MAG: phosphoglycerate kinase [Thermodesulfobacteriota bacterium]|nr:MAG: phosphoglycerate kinase [Thermodesulfobacteriota bacterium]